MTWPWAGLSLAHTRYTPCEWRFQPCQLHDEYGWWLSLTPRALRVWMGLHVFDFSARSPMATLVTGVGLGWRPQGRNRSYA